MVSSLQTWGLAVIIVVVCLFVVISAVAIYLIRKRKNKKSMNKEVNDEEKNQPPSPESTTIDEDITIDEGFIGTKDQGDDGQQLEQMTPSQIGLSPPRRERKENSTSSLSTVAMEDEENHKHIRSVFSLSPLHEHSNQTTPAAESHNEFSCSSSDITRASSPFQGQSTPSSANQFWRGPTPPWTQQHTLRSTSTAS